MNTAVPCIRDNPTPEQEAAAKAARAAAFNLAIDEEDSLSAAESEWQDYLPLCWCPKCMGMLDDVAEEQH